MGPKIASRRVLALAARVALHCGTELPMDELRFRSAVDSGLPMVVGMALAALLVRGLLTLKFSVVEGLLWLALLVLLLLLVRVVAVPCQYRLMADHLLIECGMWMRRIDYRDITGASLTRSFRLAPALSSRRVQVDHTGGRVLVSPIGRERFVAELTRRLADAAARPRGTQRGATADNR